MITSEARNQFLILSKSATGKACESFIGQLISNPQIFIFKEFLDLPNIREVIFSINLLLQIFSLKMVLKIDTTSSSICSLTELTLTTLVPFKKSSKSNYLANKGRFPELNALQLKKLKQLTLVEIAAKNKVNMTHRQYPNEKRFWSLTSCLELLILMMKENSMNLSLTQYTQASLKEKSTKRRDYSK